MIAVPFQQSIDLTAHQQRDAGYEYPDHQDDHTAETPVESGIIRKPGNIDGEQPGGTHPDEGGKKRSRNDIPEPGASVGNQQEKKGKGEKHHAYRYDNPDDPAQRDEGNRDMKQLRHSVKNEIAKNNHQDFRHDGCDDR